MDYEQYLDKIKEQLKRRTDESLAKELYCFEVMTDTEEVNDSLLIDLCLEIYEAISNEIVRRFRERLSV